MKASDIKRPGSGKSGDKPRLKTILVILYLSFLSLGLFYSVLDGESILTERDLSVFFIPPRHLWVDALKGGELPLWNPYSYIGHPLLATLQPGIFYPINILLLVLPFDLAFNWTIVLHFMLSGLFVFLLQRELKTSATGSLLGALTFMLSGYLFSVHNVISTLFTVTWVPLAILLFLRALKRDSLSYAAATGLILTVMFMGGGVEVLFAATGLLAFLSFMPSLFDFDGAEEINAGLKKRLGLLGLAFVVFVLLSAIQLLPFLELAGQSTRAGGLSYFEATTWSFDIKDLIQFFIPDPYGYGVSDEKYWSNQSWLKTVYTGVIPFILSAFFLIKTKRKALPFIFTGIAALSFSMGKNNLFYYYLYTYFPFFNKIRYPVKFLFLVFLFISIAAGLGYDSLKKGVEEERASTYRVILTLLVISTIAALIFGGLDFFDARVKMFLVERGFDYPEYNYARINVFNTKRVLFFLILFSLTLYGCFASKKIRKLLPYMIVSVLTIDLFFAHDGYYASTKASEYYKKGEVMGFLEKDKSLFRVFVTPRTMKETIDVPANGSFKKSVFEGMNLYKERVSGYNLLHGIFDIDGVEVMRRGDYTNIYSLMASQKAPDSTNILAMLNVRYVVSIPRIDSKEFKLVKVIGADSGDMKGLEGEKTLKIYENQNFLPRFFVAYKYRVIKRPDEYVKRFLDKDFSPGAEALLEEEPSPYKTDNTGKGENHYDIKVIEYGNHSITLKVKTERPGILVSSEGYYPGWKAYVDGAERKILKADYILRALPIGGGEHVVRFVYSPSSFCIGAYVSGSTLLVLLVAGAFRFYKGKVQ